MSPRRCHSDAFFIARRPSPPVTTSLQRVRDGRGSSTRSEEGEVANKKLIGRRVRSPPAMAGEAKSAKHVVLAARGLWRLAVIMVATRGADAVTCSQPSSVTGYSVTNNNLESGSFSVTVSCAAGYEGVGYAVTCATSSQGATSSGDTSILGLHESNNPGSGALCEGDCDTDDECDGNLVCKQRDATDDMVDGCGTGGRTDGDGNVWDYCCKSF